jgi:hypothetical protein
MVFVSNDKDFIKKMGKYERFLWRLSWRSPLVANTDVWEKRDNWCAQKLYRFLLLFPQRFNRYFICKFKGHKVIEHEHCYVCSLCNGYKPKESKGLVK